MPNHTPGPWEQRYFDDAQILVLGPPTDNGKRTLVATLTGNDREANARLIAAAPDMVALCHLIVDADDWCPDSRVADAIEKAKEILAREEPKGCS